MSLLPYHTEGLLEVGVDEAGRGPLIGRVYAGAVIWPNDLTTTVVKDSKKYTKTADREKAYDYVVDHAIAYGVAYAEPEEIDSLGIFKAVMQTMHRAIRNTGVNPEQILVDGNHFQPFMDQYGETPQFTTVIGGDNKYLSIAAGSVLAKVEHDRYIADLLLKYPVLERYDLKNNKGYGAPKHMEAIQKYGITQFHRQSFKCCHDAPIVYI
uniref:Ribonuclease HII n=1 Tax=viral metagenome TaxID=1070528 RepID=A0A6C0BM25_9ZZZZ